jgi:hypothetical protein
MAESQDARSLAEEAARLVAELRESLAAVQSGAEHSPSPCRACPICQVLGLIQQMSPAAVDHLAAALSELAQAARALLEPPAGSPPPAEADPAPPAADLPVAQRIHIA